MGVLRRTIQSLCVLTVLATGPTFSPPQAPESAAPFPGCRHTVRFWVDPEFTPEQTMMVVQAVYAWQDGSGLLVCFVPSGNSGLRIHRAHDPESAKWVEEKGALSNGVDPESVVGLADFPDAYILTEKLTTERDLFATAVHEVGHLLGLPHYEQAGTCCTEYSDSGAGEESWMYPSIDRDPKAGRRIPPRDSLALASLERWR